MVVGLGNPGPNYQDTRHNAGFWFVDRWAGVQGISFRKPWFRPFLWADKVVGPDRLVLVKPLTYMNLSGEILSDVFSRTGTGPEELLVVFDQMDLSPGRVRLKPHGSHAGHNGLRSVDKAVGSGAYHRLAVGIGRPQLASGILEHVLGVPGPEERLSIDSALARAVPLADEFWSRGWEPLLNAVNRRDEPS